MSSTIRGTKLRYMGSVLTGEYSSCRGYSSAIINNPRIMAKIWMMGALTIRVMNTEAPGAGLVAISSDNMSNRIHNALYTSRVTHDATDKVPEEFAEIQTPETGPNRICETLFQCGASRESRGYSQMLAVTEMKRPKSCHTKFPIAFKR